MSIAEWAGARANLLVAIVALALGAFALYGAKFHEPALSQCIEVEEGLQLCALSDMAKLRSNQKPIFEHANFSIAEGALQLHAAANEVIAHQWLLLGDSAGLKLEISPFHNDATKVKPQPVVSQFLAHYHHVDRGGYSWGPDSKVLEWPADYPDALVPQTHACSGESLYQTVPAHAIKDGSTLLWQDTYIPADMAPGQYHAQAQLMRGTEVLGTVPIKLQVWPVQLPDENTIDAVGELYRTYRMEGVGEKPDSADWRKMSNCYQQMAHTHRSTFLERNPVMPATHQQWRDYEQHYGAMLDGRLFSAERNYVGPGRDTPVSIWRTPWPQPYDMKLQRPLSYADVRQYEQMADDWSQRVLDNNWRTSRWFAYVFDEVDGPEHSERSYLAMAHQQMARVQDAIDAGSAEQTIDLLWTSHSNPAVWRDDPDLDLRGKVRLWAPNAHAADTDFFAERTRAGERVWFYHSGHPAVGAHSINASGIELRSWGVIAARYNVNGVLMWAVNLGNDDKPFADPSYKPEDDRFGNGVLVYPGRQLPKIGYQPLAGPIPSVRLKSWRRGLQDFELIQLAAARHSETTRLLVQELVPQALSEGEGKAAWPSDAGSWIEFKQRLLELASR